MSRYLGEIRQFGYVVKDIEAAMRYWSEEMGVGPFFYNPRVGIENYKFMGEPFSVHNSVALANSGGIQVELIQTRDQTPSMYREFVETRGFGLQHVAFWTTEFDADLEKALTLGFTVKMQGEVGANGRFVYFDKEYHPGTAIELSEVKGPKGEMFRMIREAAADWDGGDPVRAFPDLNQMA